MKILTKQQLQEVVDNSNCLADVIRGLGHPRVTTGYYRQVKKLLREYKIDTSHFDYYAAIGERLQCQAKPLEELLVNGSNIKSAKLKERLYRAGLLERKCRSCGQGEIWRGQKISLILDHINGRYTDNRFENLRILCPNCNASQPTFCVGNRIPKCKARKCAGCDKTFELAHKRKYCTPECRWSNYKGKPQPETRKVPRPSLEELQEFLQNNSFLAAGRKYGVSDNAVRKWIKQYEKHSVPKV